jgi:DMSO/TMAO reductase YedYZ molybdopterin-dependent catalytic subunit
MQMRNTILGFIVLVIGAAALHADSAVSVTGAVAKPGDWAVDRIKSELSADVASVEYSGHDGKHTASAVPLVSLLKASGVVTQLKQDPKADPKSKHDELHYVVTVEGSDGYYTVLSAAELLAEVGNHKAWIAIDEDGKPLADKEGPMKLIVPDDQKPARWVHSIKTISVVKIEAPATQPAR